MGLGDENGLPEKVFHTSFFELLLSDKRDLTNGVLTNGHPFCMVF